MKGSRITDPLIEYEGGTIGKGWSSKELANISKLDNQHPEGKGPVPSTQIIVEEFGGIPGLVSGLNSNADTGISESEVTNRQDVYGKNSFPPPKIATLCELIMENFNDPINVILIGAAIVSLIIGVI